MEIVVDVEMFYNNVIKELAFCSGTFHAGFIIKPPKPIVQCTKVEKCTNNWLTTHFHRIPWDAGTIEYSYLPIIVKLIRRPDAIFYTKGSEKRNILSELFNKTFIDLETMGCPKVEELPTDRDVCDSYWGHHRDSLHCAQRKAILYYDWLSNLDEIFNIVHT